jgi:peroxiredoxin
MKSSKLIATLGLMAALATGATVFAQADTGTKQQDTKQQDKSHDKDAKKDAKKEAKREKKDEKAAKSDSATAKVGQPAPAFHLKDSTGKDVSLSQYAGKVVVLEWMNPDCPVCKGKMADGSVAKMISAAHAINKDVVFLFINSTHYMADKPATSGDYLASNKITAPALIDGDGAVGKMYGAKTTPHCFVIDSKGVLVYEGAIDDKKDTNYVVNAVKALSEGKAVTPANTSAYGCSVKYKG